MWTYRTGSFHVKSTMPLHVVSAALVLCAAAAASAQSLDAVPARVPATGPGRATVAGHSVTELRVSADLPGTGELGMRAPEAVALDHRGNVVIADTGNHRVLVVGRDGSLVDEFGGYGWDADRLDTPSDVCVYEGFYTYVLDEGNRRVARYDVQGDYVDLVITEGEAGSPVSLSVGSAGGLLLVDADTQSVLSYSQFDEKLEPVGRFGLDAGGLLAPGDVAVGPSREVAVADPGQFSVEVFDEFGAALHSISSPDTLVPLDVAFDRRGNILVVDGLHNRLLAFPAGGGAYTAALSGGELFRFAAVAAGAEGELVALDDGAGRVWLIEMVYGADAREP